jgi:hypothetical protein
MKAQVFSKKIEEFPQLSQNKKISIHGMVEEKKLKASLTM